MSTRGSRAIARAIATGWRSAVPELAHLAGDIHVEPHRPREPGHQRARRPARRPGPRAGPGEPVEEQAGGDVEIGDHAVLDALVDRRDLLAHRRGRPRGRGGLPVDTDGAAIRAVDAEWHRGSVDLPAPFAAISAVTAPPSGSGSAPIGVVRPGRPDRRANLADDDGGDVPAAKPAAPDQRHGRMRGWHAIEVREAPTPDTLSERSGGVAALTDRLGPPDA